MKGRKYTYYPIKPNGKFFSEETVKSLAELGEVLGQIHKRLISEGYVIRSDGKIEKIPTIKF